MIFPQEKEMQTLSQPGRHQNKEGRTLGPTSAL